MSARKTTPGGGLGAVPRVIILAIGCVIYLAAFFSGLPKWISTIVAVVVGLVFMIDHQIRSMKGLDEARRRQRTRNLAIALALAGMVVLFYLATIVRLGPNVFNRPM
jgi:uncharacterized membrane protein